MQNIKALLFIFLFCVLSSGLKAQTVADLWISIPQDKVPYLTVNQRKEMIECFNIGVDSTVKNEFGEDVVLDTLTNDFGRFIVSDARDIQIFKFSTEQRDSVVCLIETLYSPEPESNISFYDSAWSLLPSAEEILGDVQPMSLVSRPDTMSVEEYDELVEMIHPQMIKARYCSELKQLELSLAMPFATKEEKTRLEAVVSKRMLIMGK